MAKFIGEVVHIDKYEKNGEEQKKYTNLGALFQDEETGRYSIKFLNMWLNVFEKDNRGQKPQKSQKRGDENISIEDVPF